MQFEQAVFTSTRSRKSQGYHLVAASRGVEDRFQQLLATWGPSHSSLLSDEADAESYNFHCLFDDIYALSRTTHGGPEYSGRGGLQVFTHYLIFHRNLLKPYENNPLMLALTARSLGYLRLLPQLDDLLPAIDLPDHPLVTPNTVKGDAPVDLQDVLRIVGMKNRVAIIGLNDPLPVLAEVLQETPLEDRLKVSFTTGLRPTVGRDFQIHFAHRADASFYTQLTAQGIDYVTAS